MVSLIVSVGCRKSNNDAGEKEATNVVTPMNIQTDSNDDK